MLKHGKYLCDKCGKPRGDDGCEITADGEKIEWVDLCNKCWKEVKKFVGVKK